MEFYENFRSFIKEKQLSQTAWEKELNTKQQTVSR